VLIAFGWTLQLVLNNEYEPVYQIVPVHSSRTYSLKAYVRSQDITSTSGLACA